jgi:hypothetical protein
MKTYSYLYWSGVSVPEWFVSLASNHLPITAIISNLDRNYGLFVRGNYLASLRNIGEFYSGVPTFEFEPLAVTLIFGVQNIQLWT